jgi:hypothetical protein
MTPEAASTGGLFFYVRRVFRPIEIGSIKRL